MARQPHKRVDSAGAGGTGAGDSGGRRAAGAARRWPGAATCPRSMRLVAAGCVALLVATLVPLVMISAYNHSYADDWHYAVPVHQVLLATRGDPFAALGAAFQQVGTAYVGWQGTYTAIFLMSLEPGVFSEDLYVIAAPIILVTLIACTFWSMRVVLAEWLHADKATWISVSCVIVVLQILMQPSPVEGIFWYNSAIYYTFFHSLALVLVGQVLRSIDPARTKPTRPLVTGATVLAVLVAGGNFVTALVTSEVLFAVAVVLGIRHQRAVVNVLPPLTGLLCGTVISMAAPGNAVRQATQFPGSGLGVFGTIWQSSISAFQYLSSWTTGLMLLGLGVIAVLVARTVFAPGMRRWRFPLPGAVSIASVALLATSFTPTFYSMGTVGPGRVQDVRLELYVILAVANIVWWLGWVAYRVRVAHESAEQVAVVPTPAFAAPATSVRPAMPLPVPDAASAPAPATREHARHLPAIGSRSVAGAVGLLLLVFCLTVGSMAADSKQVDTLTSTSAAKSLITGQAANYDQQVRDRISTIVNSPDDSLEVAFYTDAPKVLFMGDIRDNMNNYINYRLAQWYGKTSIIGVHK